MARGHPARGTPRRGGRTLRAEPLEVAGGREGKEAEIGRGRKKKLMLPGRVSAWWSAGVTPRWARPSLPTNYRRRESISPERKPMEPAEARAGCGRSPSDGGGTGV
eukprot:736430-Prorocentrum_minimum.AAC.1